jgi:uncharacterized iron-regulated membrane protein
MGGCVVITRNRPRSERVDSGDGGVFAAIGLVVVAYAVLLGAAAVVGHWFGVGAAQLTMTLGAALMLMAAIGRALLRGRR